MEAAGDGWVEGVVDGGTESVLLGVVVIMVGITEDVSAGGGLFVTGETLGKSTHPSGVVIGTQSSAANSETNQLIE